MADGHCCGGMRGGDVFLAIPCAGRSGDESVVRDRVQQPSRFRIVSCRLWLFLPGNRRFPRAAKGRRPEASAFLSGGSPCVEHSAADSMASAPGAQAAWVGVGVPAEQAHPSTAWRAAVSRHRVYLWAFVALSGSSAAEADACLRVACVHGCVGTVLGSWYG